MAARLLESGDYLVAEGRAAGERVAQLCRWLFIALVAALNNFALASQDRVVVNLLLGAWALASAYITVVLLLRRRPGSVFSAAVTGIDLLLAMPIVYFSGGFDSPFLLVPFLPVITSSVRSGVWAGLVSSAVIGVLYITVGSLAPHLPATPEQAHFAAFGRVFMVVVIGMAAALMSHELLRQRAAALKAAAEAESLRQLAVMLAGGLGRDEVFGALLERAMNATGANEASLFLLTGGELRHVGTRPPDSEAPWEAVVDAELLQESDAVQALGGGRVLMVPVDLEDAGKAVLRLRGNASFSHQARFQALSVARTFAGAVGGSLKLQRQAAELDTLRGRARELAAHDRRRTDVFSLVSHELRRPMAVLNVYTELLRRDLAGVQPEGTVNAMDTMAATLREMDLLIDQLQMMSRLDAGEPMPHPAELDLEEHVGLAVRAVEPLATAAHSLRVSCEAPVRVRADPQHVHLMLTNLLGNAIKYSPDGGEVLCEITAHGQSGQVAISDEGIGFSGADASLLFRRFSRLPNAAESGAGGSGLGLYICRRLARLQGGGVSAEPRAERGSTFRLSLPLAPG